MSTESEHDAEYWADVQAVIEELGPPTEEQRRVIRAVFADQRLEQQHRDTA